MRDDPNVLTGADYAGATTNASPVDRFTVPSSELLGDVGKALKDDLDGPQARDLFRKLMGHYLRELDAHAKARREMEQDEAFYDGDQWSGEDIAVLRSRGQEATVFNVIAQSINWVLGTERRGRTQHKVLPRRKEGAKAAQRKSELLKYLADVNLSDFHFSRAFSDAVKVGVGWMEGGIQSDDEGEPIYDRYESWRNIVWDSTATELDLSDARFLFRTKWVDTDTARQMFRKRETIIDLAASADHDFGAALDRLGDEPMDAIEDTYDDAGYSHVEHPAATRSRIRLIEAWFKVPTQSQRISGGDFSGELYDPSSPGHVEQVAAGMANVSERLTYRTFCMIFCGAGPLYLCPSPYRHNRYPITPIWGYRKASDGTPYGLIRAMRDAQRDINKRFSKAQYILNSQKVVMDEGAVEDLDEFAEEVARPDSIIVKRQGKELRIDVDKELAASHLEIMRLSTNMIQTLSGITDESLGRTTNATSGRAIVARQEQGALATTPVFDNLRLARQYHGEKMLSLVEQFVSEQKQFRITNMRGNPEYVTVNDGLPENDIVRTKADFIITEADWNATLRQAKVQELMDVIAQLAPVAPDVVMVLLDLVVEAMDIPQREEIVKRIRQVTGQEDPDADPNTPDPEREAREAAKAAQAELAQRAAMAELGKLEGEAAEKQARAIKAQADAEKVLKSLPADSLAQQRAALELAIQMLQAEPAVDTADALLRGAGAVTPPMDAAPMPAAPMPPAEPPAGPMPPQGVPM